MAKVEPIAATFLSSGSKTIVLNDSSIDIEKVVLYIVSSTGEKTAGFSDSVTNFSGNLSHMETSTTKTLSHYRTIGGIKTKVFEATIPSNAFSDTGELKLDITTLTEMTQVLGVVYGN